MVGMVSSSSVLHDEPAAQHAHPAGEHEIACLCRRQLDRGLSEGGQALVDPKIWKDDLFRAT
ncbi:hypothetical protein NITLEN_60121 [Nitrospira lenta]|uniref:Uncharacterized protein n=1 Tax=Nitrospira lenta TaxID=1436998 RepID=A0A330LAM5_9BACT|nr:hypothetical protein NITLEN_60121 [Nitrospira lenta]